MNKVKEILAKILDTVNLDEEKNLVSDGFIESMDLINIVSELECEFDIEIDFLEISKENFENVESVWEMVKKIKAIE